MTKKKTEALLQIEKLKTYFFTDEGTVKAVDGIDLSIFPRKTLGLVGESGCGKTVTALSIMGLLPPYGRVVEGRILFEGRDLRRLKERELNKVRGKEIGMVFQEPMTSLNPIFTVGHQIEEAIIFHQERNKKEARQIALDMLKKVELPSPEEQLNEYPHQLSGGMKQRVMIAMALSCGPKLLIADEPATALDVTIQREILELLLRLQNEYNMSILLITHDLGVVNLVAERIAVMYASKIAEYATRDEIFSNPKHPYTIGLLNSIPKIGEKRKSLQAIPGQPPDPLAPIEGCRFHPRCFFATKKCIEKEPVLEEISPDHKTACWRHSIVDKQSWLEYSKRGNKNAIM
ncbi:MAG TPA: ABC transporter ATP-binding protein [Candidatus Omnitrophica bacterium]|nr:ABC transporter ATP-binding protein [Candidatus Omnitrophota bacterium]